MIELKPLVGGKVADAAVVKRFASGAYQFGSPLRGSTQNEVALLDKERKLNFRFMAAASG